MIAVIIPTRGLLFAEVLEAIEMELVKVPHRIYSSWDLKIPESFNTLVDKALEDHPSHLWFVEEDTVPPVGSFENLILAQANIACIDYGVSGWGCVTKNILGEILWCGLGCTLVDAGVFRILDKPYFRSDIELRLNDWKWIPAPKNKYGGQDIYFCTMAREKGFTIKQVAGECKHLKLSLLGQPEINNGLHLISEKPKIEKRQIL